MVFNEVLKLSSPTISFPLRPLTDSSFKFYQVISAKMAGTTEHRKELLDILSEVKTRVQDNVGSVEFPIPQFIIIGKQSVGKSRIIETFAVRGKCEG